MAGKTREETEQLTAVARATLPTSSTARDVLRWWATHRGNLGAKTMGAILYDRYLELESRDRDLQREIKQRIAVENMPDRKFGYYERDLNARGYPQPGSSSEWKRRHDQYDRVRKEVIADEEKPADIEFSEGEGERR